jgi:hypothetical protein
VTDEDFLEALQRRDAASPVLFTGFVNARSGFAVCIHNDAGGTTELPPRRYRVGVVRSFEDYETGRRMVGRLLDDADLALARAAGTTSSPTKAAQFLPAVVYFDAGVFEPEVGGPRRPGRAVGQR